MEWLRGQFDKIILVFMLLVMLALTIHSLHHSTDQTATAWFREQTNTVIGALIGMITGGAIQRMADKPHDAKPNNP